MPGRPKGAVPPDDKRCNYKKGREDWCKGYRMNGGTVCSFHGKAEHTQNAAQRRHANNMAKSRAMKKLEREGYPVVNGPEAVIEMLEERLGVQIGMARALDEIVRRLTEMEELRYESRAGEQIRGEVQAWIQINQMVTKLGADYLKIGLDERKVRIAEAQAQILMGVIQAILVRLELTSEQRKAAAVIVPQELERAAIEGGK